MPRGLLRLAPAHDVSPYADPEDTLQVLFRRSAFTATDGGSFRINERGRDDAPKDRHCVWARLRHHASGRSLLSRGGEQFATGLLETAFGREKAVGMVGRVMSQGVVSFDFLNAADPTQLATILDGEMPTTVAVVLANLRADRAAQEPPVEFRVVAERVLGLPTEPTLSSISTIAAGGCSAPFCVTATTL